MGYRDIFNIVIVLYWLYMDIMIVNWILFGCHRGDTIFRVAGMVSAKRW